MTEPHEGIFIVIEGIDGAGKTTQVNLLKDALAHAGYEVVISKEPTDSEYGRLIRNSAKLGRHSPEEELDLFLKDRAQHVETLIKPAVAAGKIVILDRYFYSTLAYQGSRAGNIAELRAEMERRFPIPDIVIILDMPPDASRDRITHSRGEQLDYFESMEGLHRARAVFLALMDSYIIHVDASMPASAVHDAIMAVVCRAPRMNPDSKRL